MSNELKINPAIIVQSTLALTVAITCTDMIRETIAVFHPKSAMQAVAMRAIALTFLIIIVIMITSNFSVCHEAAKPENIALPHFN